MGVVRRRLRIQNVDVTDPTALTAAMNTIGTMLNDLEKAVNNVGFFPVGNNQKPGNVDGIWLVYNFTVNGTDIVVPHSLGRVPVGLLQAQCVPTAGELVQNGFVTIASATLTTITLQCTISPATCRLLLF